MVVWIFILKNINGYQPTHDLEEGLKEAVDWYWGNLKD